MTPDKMIPTWNATTAYMRVQECRFLLLMHDFLTEAANSKVRHRIHKWV